MPTGSVSSVLAFDFGRRRIGVAAGSSVLKSGEPIGLIEIPDETERFQKLGALIEEWRPDVLVVGRPVHPDGQTHEMTLACERFARQLQGRFDLPVVLVDERYSSAAASADLSEASEHSVGDRRRAGKLSSGNRKSGQRSRGKLSLDAHAAAIILRQYWSELDTAAQT